jgi:hypothetical protein
MEYGTESVVNVRDYRSVSDTDRPNMLRLFVIYELPFGRGRALGGSMRLPTGGS